METIKTNNATAKAFCSIVTLSLLIAGCAQTPKHAQTDASAAPSSASPAATDQSSFKLAYALTGQDMQPKDGFWKSTPRLADIDGDNQLELLAYPRLLSGVYLWKSGGMGDWRQLPSGIRYEGTSCGGGVATGDINGDKRMDMVIADHCRGLFVYLANSSGQWQEAAHPLSSEAAKRQKDDINPYSGAEDVALGDINHDGKLDIVATSTDYGGFTVFLGDGGGKRWKEVKGDGLPSADDPEPGDEQEAGWAMEVLLADINADGNLDVAASYYKGPRVWLGDGKGKWKAYSENLPTPSVGGLYRQIAIADLNKDGRPDLVAANSVNGAEVYLQTEHGWADTLDPYPELRGGAESVAAEDLDHDGNVDLVVGGRLSEVHESGYGLFILQGDGKGGFAKIGAVPNLPKDGLKVVWGLTTGDINRDGWPDLVAATGGVTPVHGAGASLPALQVWLAEARH